MAAPNLAQRFLELKKQVGGNREKQAFEFTFGRTPEEGMGITAPAPHIVRILSQLHYALEMQQTGACSGEEAIGQALGILENHMRQEGVLTRDACMEAENALMPLSGAARSFDLIYVGHAHIDMNWMWGMQETVAATLSTFRSVLHMMDEYPDFTFMQSQAAVYEIVERYDPELMQDIIRRIWEGRWEITANAWVETDKNMPDTESLLHHVSVTRAYMEKTWGVDTRSVQVDFSPDTFGHSRFIPEINSFAGIRYYYHCRGTQQDEVLFRYRAPSGHEVLTYKEPYWYNSGVNPDNAIGLPQLTRKCRGLKTGLIVYGVGNHGGGPTRRDIERVREMASWPVFPSIRFGTLHEYFHRAESVYDRLPVLNQELNPIFTGCYTTQSRIKAANRKAELSVRDASLMSALGRQVCGCEYPGSRLDRAWRDILFTHFHDILTGSCVQESREYAMGLLADAMGFTQTALGNTLRVISEHVDTSQFQTGEDISLHQAEGAGAGAGVGFGVGTGMGRELNTYFGVPNPERGSGRTRVYTVFNTSCVDRTEVAELLVWDYTGDLSRLEAVDAAGHALPLQIPENMPQRYWDHIYARVLVQVSVPALGYSVIALQEKALDRYPVFRLNDVRVDPPTGPMILENEYLRAEIGPRQGALVSLINKESYRQQLSAPAGLCLAMADSHTSDAWRIGRYFSLTPAEGVTSMKFIPGPVRQCVEMEQQILSSTVKTRITLDRGSRDLHYEWEIDWNETSRNPSVPVLLFVAPLTGNPPAATRDVPGGFVSSEPRHLDVPCLSFLSAENAGTDLTLISDSKYGFRFAEHALTCTLIHSAGNPDPYPERGLHRISLWISTVSGSPLVRKQHAEALTRPLIPMSTRARAGQLPTQMQFMKISSNVLLTGVESTEDGRILVRVCETEGKPAQVTLSVPFPVREACLTDMRLTQTGTAEVSDAGITFTAPAHSITQLLMTPGNSSAESV